MVAAGFNAEGLKGPSAASFTVWDFAELAVFAEVAGFGEAAGFAEVTCLAGLPCFGEPLNISDSQPASLTSIGSSTNAAIAAMMVRRRGQKPKLDPANFIPDDSNPYFLQRDSLFALYDSMAA